MHWFDDLPSKSQEALTGKWTTFDGAAVLPEKERDLLEARERARLSVLRLTTPDKQFLKAMKIAT
jgi:hypothetical protein